MVNSGFCVFAHVCVYAHTIVKYFDISPITVEELGSSISQFNLVQSVAMRHLKCICNTFRNELIWKSAVGANRKGFHCGEIFVRNTVSNWTKNVGSTWHKLTLFKFNPSFYCAGISQKFICDCDLLCSAGLSQKSALCWVCPEYIQGETQRKYFIRSAKTTSTESISTWKSGIHSIRISRLPSLSLRMSLGTLQMKPLPSTVSFFGSDVKCPFEIGLCISSHHGGNNSDLFSSALVQFYLIKDRRGW